VMVYATVKIGVVEVRCRWLNWIRFNAENCIWVPFKKLFRRIYLIIA
jgi:hypothetical protein